MLIMNKHSGYVSGVRLYRKKDQAQAASPDPALIAAQIKSMGFQDQAIQSIMQNSEDLAPLQKEQMQFSLDSSKTAYDQSQSDREWMLSRRGSLSTLQDTLVKDAKDFNTEDRTNQLVGQAKADVAGAFADSQAQNARAMARMGVNPSDGMARSIGNQTAIAQAAAIAGASNKARSDARTEGYALTDRATNALAGYPAQASGATSAGATYGTTGLNVANAGAAGLNAGSQSAASIAGAMGTNATNMWNSQANYQTNMANANQSESFGSILGGVGGLASGAAKLWTAYSTLSDRRLKDNIVLVGKDSATGLNLYEFNYKTQPALRFRGVMADEVEAFMPGAVSHDAEGFMAVDYGQIGIEMVEV